MEKNNTINGRMPQTIKKRVGCWNAFRQRKCPAAKDITFKEPGACENCALRVPNYTVEQAMVDILEYAEQLERECNELLQKNQQLERERDAAVEEIFPTCANCKHEKLGFGVGPCPPIEEYLTDDCSNWQWRGVQEVE